MTIPWMMNCSHSESGWCLDCVVKLGNRYQWAANELLACDYGDNSRGGIGWLVYGWRDQGQKPDRKRIYGGSIDEAIDAELRGKP